MSEIKVSCPGCAQHLKLPEEYIGQTLPCPACSAEITVPIILGGIDAIPREAAPEPAAAPSAAPPPPPPPPAAPATPKAAPPPPPPAPPTTPDLARAAKAASSPAAPMPAKKKRAVPIWMMIVLPLTLIAVIVRLILGPLQLDVPLLNAVVEGDETEVRRLLSDGHDISEADSHGTTVLHLTDNADLLNMLIAKGADLNAQDADGNTPLHSAAKDGLTAAVEALIEAGAQLNIKNELGETPLDLTQDGSVLRIGIERAGGKRGSDL